MGAVPVAASSVLQRIALRGRALQRPEFAAGPKLRNELSRRFRLFAAEWGVRLGGVL